jgi:hypothetical protein
MDLKRDKRQNIQKKLDLSSEQTGEARHAGREETESRQARHEPESPANTIRLMEEVCERENLLEALRRVKGNKGSAGIDGTAAGPGHTTFSKPHSESNLQRAHTARRVRVSLCVYPFSFRATAHRVSVTPPGSARPSGRVEGQSCLSGEALCQSVGKH